MWPLPQTGPKAALAYLPASAEPGAGAGQSAFRPAGRQGACKAQAHFQSKREREPAVLMTERRIHNVESQRQYWDNRLCLVRKTLD